MDQDLQSHYDSWEACLMEWPLERLRRMTLRENVFSVAGQPALSGEVFVGIDSRANPTWTIMAITSRGRLFYRSWVASAWRLILDGPSAPTPTASESWGHLKSRYR